MIPYHNRFVIAFCVMLISRGALSGNVTTTPLQFYGLGTLDRTTYSPDGKYIITGGSMGVFLWDIASAQVARVFSGQSGWVLSVAFSRDGTKVLAASGETAKIWNAADGTLLRMFSGHTGGTYSVAFSADAKEVLTGGEDGTAKLWNAETGNLIRTFSGHTSVVWSVAFSPNETEVLTGSRDKTAKLWNATNGNLIRTFSGDYGEVRSVAFSPDGTKILTGGTDSVAKIWDVSTGSLLKNLVGHGSWIHYVAFSPDGTKALTGSWDWTAKLWDVSSGSVLRTFSHADYVFCVGFSPDGTKVLTSSYDMTAKIWDASTGAVLQTFYGHTGSSYGVAFSPDGATVMTGDRKKVRLRSTATGTVVRTLLGHSELVRSIVFSRDGSKALTASEDGTAKLWNVGDSALIRTFSPHGDQVCDAAFSPDESKILTASMDRTARIWQTSNSTLLRTFSGHTGGVHSAKFSPDGTKVLTASEDRTARLWDAANGNLIHTFSGHTDAVWYAVFSPDGTKILTSSWDSTARLWTTDGTLIRTFSASTSGLFCGEFSPDGTRVLTAGGEATARIWNASDGTPLRTFAGRQGTVVAAKFSGEGTRVLTGHDDGVARLWLAENTGDKILLVAGGGNYIGNPIVSQTQALADRAFFTCLVRGYKREEIRYLSAFNDWQTRDSNGDGLPDADSPATIPNLWSAIDTWSSGTARLFIYLVDHGSYNSQTGDWFFRLNPTQYINAHDLDAHLDALQAATGCEIILIVDCCYSGGFVQDCRATTGARRVVIASTTATDLAIFTPPAGAESFSFFFFSFAILGNTIEDCFDWTRMAFQAIGNPAGQKPWMDDDNDGDSDKWDGALAGRHVLGRYPAFGLNAPTITAVASTQTITLGQTATLWAQLSEAVAAKEVWALLIAKGATYTPDQPVTTLSRINLSFNAALKRWQAALTPVSQPVGQLSVVYFAMSEDALGTRLLATPVAAGLTVLGSGYDVRFDKASSLVSEGVGTTNLLLRLSKAATWPVTASLSATGSATPGSDYATLPASLTFNAGQTTKTLAVRIINDTVGEYDETLIVTLTGATGAALGATRTHTLTIRDNDPPPRPTAISAWSLYR